MRASVTLWTLLALFFATPTAHCQAAQAPVEPQTSQQPAAMPQQPTEGAQGMQGMDKMADSVTKMSEICQMMMQKEMAAMPYKIAAGIVIGVLLFVALVLFIVLEIQWIKYWRVLLKRQRETDLSGTRGS